MRKLGLRDVFAFSEIMDKMDLNIDAAGLVNQAQGKEDAQSFVGGQIAMMLLRNFYKAEESVTNWLCSLNGMTVDEINMLGIVELTNLVKEIFTGDDVADFFNYLSSDEQD